ncbi:MAG: large-conductance mechanosensitive channel protein MscL [Rudaea sp.]|uniref:large-conductance mechanosensitive channel protein MscL n=1 Tax=Rudaea sp. TaxID=2136325 RepID=UPI0039E618BA
MSLATEFKAFIQRGNALDLAVGVVIGAAFGKIVTSLVDNIIMPPIGLLIGGVDFSAWKWILKAAGADGKGEVAIGIGVFVNTIIQFLIIAAAIFLVVKVINSVTKKPEPAPAAPPEPTPTEKLLTEIRDALKK